MSLKEKNDIIYKLQDYTHLEWNDRTRISQGTPGSFLKTYEGDGVDRIYYKLSNSDYRGIYGHESVNELIASRLLDVLGIDHVSYRLIHSRVRIDNAEYETWMCSSRNFRKDGQDKIAFDAYFEMMREDDELPIDFCKKRGWDEQIYKMMVFDYLICNRDRHGANIELLQTGDEVMLAPLFDHGLSLIFSCYDSEDAVSDFDVMKDYPVNNYFFSRSLEYNLRYVPKSLKINHLHEDDYDYIMHGIDKVLPKVYGDKIWEMITGRWKKYEEIQNSK